jgi:hypothetical protein
MNPWYLAFLYYRIENYVGIQIELIIDYIKNYYKSIEDIHKLTKYHKKNDSGITYRGLGFKNIRKYC